MPKCYVERRVESIILDVTECRSICFAAMYLLYLYYGWGVKMGIQDYLHYGVAIQAVKDMYHPYQSP